MYEVKKLPTKILYKNITQIQKQVKQNIIICIFKILILCCYFHAKRWDRNFLLKLFFVHPENYLIQLV